MAKNGLGSQIMKVYVTIIPEKSEENIDEKIDSVVAWALIMIEADFPTRLVITNFRKASEI